MNDGLFITGSFSQQSVKRHTLFRRQKRVEHGRQSLHFCRQCLPDEFFLQERIAGLHQAMFGEVVQEFMQDIDWLATDSCSLLGTKKHVMAICRRAEAIAEQF